MKVIIFVCLIVSLFILPKQLHSQSCLTWQQVIGGAEDERGLDIVFDDATNTYWACGYVTTTDTTNTLSKNGWLANFDKNGNLIKEIVIEEQDDLTFNKMDLLGSRIIVGGNIYNRGENEPGFVMYSFNTNGELQVSLPNYGVGEVTALKIFGDGSFLIALNSLDDIYIYKFFLGGLSIGGVSRFNGSNIERVNEIIDDNGRVIMVGVNSSEDGSASNYLGGRDVWLFEIDVTLRIINEKSFGGASSETAVGFVKTPDNGLVILAEILGAEGDITTSYGNGDYWAFKLDEDWNIVWEKTYGGGSSDFPKTIAAFNNGDVLIGGITLSFDNDIEESFGYFDTWISRLNGETGDLLWSQSIGGDDLDFTAQLSINSEDKIVAIGNTDSNSIGCKSDCGTPHEFQNIWIYSLDEAIILDAPIYNAPPPNIVKVFCVDGWLSLTNTSNKIKNYKVYKVNGVEYGNYQLLPYEEKSVFIDGLRGSLVLVTAN